MRRKRKKSYYLPRWQDVELWSINRPLALIISETVKAFRKQGLHSYPTDITFAEWKEVLRKIEDGFGAYAKDNIHTEEEDYVLMKEAMDLFAQYFEHLWD